MKNSTLTPSLAPVDRVQFSHMAEHAGLDWLKRPASARYYADKTGLNGFGITDMGEIVFLFGSNIAGLLDTAKRYGATSISLPWTADARTVKRAGFGHLYTEGGISKYSLFIRNI